MPKSSAALTAALDHALSSPQITSVTNTEKLFDAVLVCNRIEDQAAADMAIQSVRAESRPSRAAGAKFPVLIEVMDDGAFVDLEMEYFEEAMSREMAKALAEEMARIMNSLGS